MAEAILCLVCRHDHTISGTEKARSVSTVVGETIKHTAAVDLVSALKHHRFLANKLLQAISASMTSNCTAVQLCFNSHAVYFVL